MHMCLPKRRICRWVFDVKKCRNSYVNGINFHTPCCTRSSVHTQQQLSNPFSYDELEMDGFCLNTRQPQRVAHSVANIACGVSCAGTRDNRARLVHEAFGVNRSAQTNVDDGVSAEKLHRHSAQTVRTVFFLSLWLSSVMFASLLQDARHPFNNRTS